jgi:radical SAM superfamily enzyme YgiQ (UPF0313 family)
MKIVLVRPPFYALFGLTTPRMKTYSLNLLYLATFARDRGRCNAAVVDGENIFVPDLQPADPEENDPETIIHRAIPGMVRVLGQPDHPLWVELERRILLESPDLVGITCNSGNMDAVRLIVGRLKRFDLPVILGGSHPTALPEQSITYTGADMVAVGEGELTLIQAAERLRDHESLSDILSIAWKSNGRVMVNPRRGMIDPIEDLPIPDRSFINRSDYFGEVIMTGRGCPFDCSYCASKTIWGRRVRLRSVSSIIDELKMLYEAASSSEQSANGTAFVHERPGRWVVKVLDDTFTLHKKRTIELLDAIVAHGLNRFEFTGGVRADTLDEAVVERMRRANFRRVTLGVESGSPRILKMIRKGETNEDVKRALTLLRDAGIYSHAFFMIGFPDETPDDIELSKKLILEARPDHVEINMVTPYPGTEIFNKLIAEDPSKIDRWYRWFHQGMSTHSDRIGYDLDRAYEDFLAFAKEYHRGGDRQLSES